MRLLKFESPTGTVWLNPKYVWNVGEARDKGGHMVIGTVIVGFVTGSNVALQGSVDEVARLLMGKTKPAPDYLKGGDGNGN